MRKMGEPVSVEKKIEELLIKLNAIGSSINDVIHDGLWKVDESVLKAYCRRSFPIATETKNAFSLENFDGYSYFTSAIDIRDWPCILLMTEEPRALCTRIIDL